MAWIESHESLPSHPKTKRMCRLLKITPVVAVGHLHFFWWWAMNHAQDGLLDKYSSDDIADACAWDGDPELFFNVLIHSGFVERTDDGHYIHDWYDYAGKLIALRQKDAERKRNSRGKKVESEGNPEDVPGTSEGHLAESIRNPNPNPNLNLKDTTSRGDAIKIYQNEIGIMSSTILQLVLDDIKTYSEDWVVEAIQEAARNNVRKYVYVQSILQRWGKDGKQSDKVISLQTKQQPAAPKEYIPDPELLARVRAANGDV